MNIYLKDSKMCISARASIIAFIIGIISSVILINYGNKKYENENKVVGYFFIFVVLMQLVDFMIWIDLKCCKGLNTLATFLGSIFNNIQPFVLFLLANHFLEKKNDIVTGINYLYFIYFIWKTLTLYQKEKLCVTTNSEGHLDWIWKYDFNYMFYFIVLLMNVFFFFEAKYIIVVIILSMLTLIGNIFKFKKSVGELWCVQIVIVPLIHTIYINFFLN